MRFFIVDDEREIVDLYEEIVVLSGHTVIGTASNGAEAVRLYMEFDSPPDAVIMDHRMPVKTGLEATREILKLNPRANVIFASADESVAREAAAIGAISFKKKPFTVDRLISNIEKTQRIIDTQRTPTAR